MNAEKNRGACPRYEAKLEDYVSGQLSGLDARRVVQHLGSCAACCLALEDAVASVRLLRLAEAAGDPGPGFARMVMAHIRSECEASIEAKGFWQPFVSLAWRFAATATLTLAVMVTYDVAWHARTAEPNVASVRGIEMRDLFTTDADRVPVNRDDVLLMVAESNHGKH
jgi:anti-sigma factor RsiW